jgi:uncharacterized membrane protein
MISTFVVPTMAVLLAQGAMTTPPDPGWLVVGRELWAAIEPYKYFLLVLIVFWLVARRSPPARDDFNRQAQQVLDEKFRKGEISKKAYDKYRQDISFPPRR